MKERTHFPESFELDFRKQNLRIGEESLTLIAGPCALESSKHSLFLANEIRDVAHGLGLGYIFKGSYDKDARSSADSFHGVGLDQGIEILGEVREASNVPVTTDFSRAEDAQHLAGVIDLLQVPAYLCRQTSILSAAGETGLPVHLKKGQFMAPENLRNSADKLLNFGTQNLILTDRGTFMGYGDLVNDFRSQQTMAKIGVPGYDATHSIQQPTTSGKVSEGLRSFIPSLTRAAVASGAKVLFFEVHDSPNQALSDPGTVLDLRHLEDVLLQATAIWNAMSDLGDKNLLDIEVS